MKIGKKNTYLLEMARKLFAHFRDRVVPNTLTLVSSTFRQTGEEVSFSPAILMRRLGLLQ